MASWPLRRTGECQKDLREAPEQAMNPTQNKIRYVRWARAYTRSDPDTQNANRISRIPVTKLTHQ